MKKEEYIKVALKKYSGKTLEYVIKAIDNYYSCNQYVSHKNDYKIGDMVYLKKDTLLHGTFKNYDGLVGIVNNGLIGSIFSNNRISKYPSSVCVWKLKKDGYLKDYINFYNGGTIKYHGLIKDKEYTKENKTEVISFDEMANINNHILNNPCRMWTMEQTKEARFMPSMVQDIVQIGIIFNIDNEFKDMILQNDILNPKDIDDKSFKELLSNEYDTESICDERYNKDDFYTDRESAILFGIPSSFIAGILVGREYEQDNLILNKIKKLLPNCYICNLDGKIIL